MGKVYLLDSNVFIEAANRYYAFDICPGFWDWLDQVCPDRDVCSIEPVYRELADKSDQLAVWVKDRKEPGRFLQVDDDNTQQHFKEIARTIQAGPADNAAKRKFLAGADPWLVAKALTEGATVVTHEVVVPAETRKRVSLANVCRDFGVTFIDSFALLRHHGAVFRL